MAAKYDWGDGKGKVHSISKAQHDANVAAKSRVAAPPLGYYDPNLDAQERAETRGYDSTIDDVNWGRLYAGEDLGIAKERAGVDKGRNQEDYDSAKAGVERGSGRSLSDLLTQRERTGQDYGTSLANLQRSYDRLANQQGEGMRKAGAEASGGAYAQSARKRTANQALDKAPIDTAYQRFMQDSTTGETRIGEDKATSLEGLLRGYDRGNQDIDWNIGQTGLNYNRQMQGYLNTEQRAGDEHSSFGQDIDTARQMQWGGPAITGAGTPVADPYAPKPAKGITTSIGAGPGFPSSKKRRKGRTITYTSQAGAP